MTENRVPAVASPGAFLHPVHYMPKPYQSQRWMGDSAPMISFISDTRILNQTHSCRPFKNSVIIKKGKKRSAFCGIRKWKSSRREKSGWETDATTPAHGELCSRSLWRRERLVRNFNDIILMRFLPSPATRSGLVCSLYNYIVRPENGSPARHLALSEPCEADIHARPHFPRGLVTERSVT